MPVSIPTLLLILALSLLGGWFAARADSSAGQIDGGPAPLQLNALEVDYAADWVAGATYPGVTAVVTVTDSVDTLKGTATVTTDIGGDFFVSCEDWDGGDCPDILPGDKLLASADGYGAEIAPIGTIMLDLPDAPQNVVSGRLYADAYTQTLDVRCEIWEESGPAITTSAASDGGGFSCDFDDVGWDLEPRQPVAVRYLEPDGDSVITELTWPWLRVNSTDEWVGGDCPAGYDLAISIYESGGLIEKGATTAENTFGGGWEGPEGFSTEGSTWSPGDPNIVPGDEVLVEAYHDSTVVMSTTLEVGDIVANVSSATDLISGTVYASSLVSVPVECHPWGAWEAGIDAPIKQSWAQPDGSVPFTCAWDPATEWDVQPGQAIAAMYVIGDEGDRIIEVFEEPSPLLGIETWANCYPTADGNLRLQIETWNEGSAPAENVNITSHLDGLSYITDTLGIVHEGTGSGPIVWNVGTLDPDTWFSFDLYVDVTAALSDVVTHTASIASIIPPQATPVYSSWWASHVEANDTNLQVSKGAWTGEPAADQHVVFEIDVCNLGNTGSGAVTLTDTLPADMVITSWWAYQAGWTEVLSQTSALTVTVPSLDGGACNQVLLRGRLSDQLAPGDPLTNTAIVTATNDLSPDDNLAAWEGWVAEPRVNLAIDKGWAGGQLVPGGQLRYVVEYGNDGNMPVGAFPITDTFPVSTTFASAWHHDPWGGYPFEPSYVDADMAIWEIPSLENGFGGSFEVILDVDPDIAPGTVLVNSVAIGPQPAEETLDDNGAEWTEIVRTLGPNLRIRKWAEWLDNEAIRYAVQFENVGSDPVSNVWITDTLPVDTEWAGDWDMEFDWERLESFDYSEPANQLRWAFSPLYPGESGWLQFDANLLEPGAPVRWYTNTVEIDVPVDDPSPADNGYTAVSFSGGELHRVELWVNHGAPSGLWGEAISGLPVTVTTPVDSYHAWADPACDGCWSIEDAGVLAPGDPVQIVAGEGLMPVSLVVPDPFDAVVDSVADEVTGQIDALAFYPIEIHGDWDGGYQAVETNASGAFQAVYPVDIPRGATGYVRYVDMADYATIVWHRPLATLDLLLVIDYAHDWVQSPYELGHTATFTVTDDLGMVKATAGLESTAIPDWGGTTGFSTNLGEPWDPERPDIVPGDWVYGTVDNGYESSAHIGDITGGLDMAGEVISGTITAPWPGETLDAWCAVWVEGGPEIGFTVSADGGAYACGFAAAGWDLRPGQEVAVGYIEPDGDRVMNVFVEPLFAIYLPEVLRNH